MNGNISNITTNDSNLFKILVIATSNISIENNEIDDDECSKFNKIQNK